MAKIITVWGNSGGGKSTFCCVLAKALTESKQKAIIISGDENTPMLPIWLPEQVVDHTFSLGTILSSLEIDSALVASKVTIVRTFPFIGLLGYTASENPMSYPKLNYESIKTTIYMAAKLVDYLIIDCSSIVANFFTPAAIECADMVIRIVTPDLRGINYLKAQAPLLTDQRFGYESHITLAGQARPFHALDEMGHLVKGFQGILPYGKEIERCMTSGDLFKVIKFCNPKYILAIDEIVTQLEEDGYEDEDEDKDNEDKEDDYEEEDKEGQLEKVKRGGTYGKSK